MALEDQAILKALREGKNQQVLQELYVEVFPKVKKFIQGTADDLEEAEDIFQDALMVFFKQVKLNKFDDQYDIAGFIYTVSRNLWFNRQKRKNRNVVSEEHEMPHPLLSNRLDEMLAHERRQLIQEIFDQLDDRCKELLNLTVMKSLAMEDVVVRMGFSTEGAASVANFRCKKKLADLMKVHQELKKHIRL